MSCTQQSLKIENDFEHAVPAVAESVDPRDLHSYVGMLDLVLQVSTFLPNNRCPGSCSPFPLKYDIYVILYIIHYYIQYTLQYIYILYIYVNCMPYNWHVACSMLTWVFLYGPLWPNAHF